MNRSLHVLLLDDDEKVLRLLKIFMKQLGHRVTTAQNGREGIRQMLRHQFDMILVDAQMPEVDGVEFTTKVLEIWPWEKIVFCTGHLDKKLLKQTQELGIHEIIQKPVSLNSLEQVIERTLGPEEEREPGIPPRQTKFEVGYLRRFTMDAMQHPYFASVIASFPKSLRKGIPCLAAGIYAIQNQMGRYVISSDLPLDEFYLNSVTNEIVSHLSFYSGTALPCMPQPEVNVLDTRRDPMTAEGHQIVMVPMIGAKDMLGIAFVIIEEDDSAPPAPFYNLCIATHHLTTVLQCIDQAQKERMQDPLTDLWSWAYMEKQVKLAWTHMEKHQHAVGWIDLDVIGFKAVNDTHGFVTGHEVLQSVAGVIESQLEEGELCGRRAADEFCILLPNTSETRLQQLSESLADSISKLSLLSEDEEETLECAVGYAIADGEHEMNSASQLVECAEHARFVAEREPDQRVKSWEHLQETGEASISVHPILVVDDDPQILVLIDRILGNTLYEVVGCSSVAEAVSLMQKGKRFEVMLTDLVLNHQDGMEMIRLGKEIDPDMIPMVISGNITKDSEEKLLARGANEIIKKPFEPKYLRSVVASAAEEYTRNLRKSSAETTTG